MQQANSFRSGRPISIRILYFLLSLALVPSLCFGQAQNTGTIAGNVFDSSHSVIPGASVTLTSEERGNVSKTTANAQGEFTFNDMQVGTYTLQVEFQGFSVFVSKHVILDSDTRLRIDATLKAGNVNTEVEVTADQVAVDTQSATVSQVIDNELVENLPIDGNNVVALAALLPGVTDVSAPTTFTDENGGATFTANGARGNSNLFLFDGLLWNNLYLNTGINYPNHAALQQVSVQLNNFAAQYGRSAGAIFNVVSKSGGNKTHGEVFFHFHDAELLDAKGYFSHKIAPQHTYQYGGAVGGPIVKDKLFYEAEYQALTGFSSVQANAETLSLAEEGFNAAGAPLPCTAPKLLGKQCSSFAGDAKVGVSPSTLIVNPVFNTNVYSTPAGPSTTCPTGTTCPVLFSTHPTVATPQLQSTWAALGNSGTAPCITTLQGLGAGFLANAEIPAECFDPVVQNVIKAGYIPNPDTQLGSSQYLYSAADSTKPNHEYGGFMRVDWILSPRQTMAFRFFRTENSDLTANGGGNADTGVPTYEVDENAAYITAGSVEHRWILSSSVVNDLIVGYKRYEYNVVPSDQTNLNTLGSKFVYPGYQSLPKLVINTRFNLGDATDAYTRSVNENGELIDNVSWVKGRHNFQFGLDYLHEVYLNVRANPGTFNFYGNPGYTDAQASDFILGLLYSMQIGNTQRISAVQNAIYGYGQDTWRISRKTTLSLGLRYELANPWYQPENRAATFIRGYQSTVIPNAPAGMAFLGDPGVPKSLIKTDYTNAAPRVGIAYDVFGNGKTAIKTGFGIFYDAIPATIVGLTQPYTYRANYQFPTGSLTDPLAGLPAIPLNYSGTGTAQFTTPYSIIFPDHNFRNAYILATNFGVQQQVSKGSIVEVNYLGRFGRHQMIPVDENPAIYDCTGAYFMANPIYCAASPTLNYALRVLNPGYNYGGQGIVDLLSEATSNYNALQVTYRQRAYKNLTVLTNYTYSRTIDVQSTLSTNANIPQPGNLRTQYAASDLNTTQIFNLGWRLSFPKIRSSSAIINNVFNEWSFNGIYNARTGHPVNLTFGGDQSGTDEMTQRVYLTPGISPTLPYNRHRTAKIQEWFNTDTGPASAPTGFMKPAPFTFGNVGRNSIIGPAAITTQMSMTKNIGLSRFREGMHAQFRTEAFGVFNTINLSQPRSNFNASSAQASTFGSINSGSGNRRIQFGMIVYF